MTNSLSDDSLIPLGQLMALCEQVSPATVDVLSSLLSRRLSHGVSDQDKPAFRHAGINLVNFYLKQGRMDQCLLLIKQFLSCMDVPELLHLQADLGRHLSSAVLRQASQQALAQADQFVSGLARPARAADHQLIADASVPWRVAFVMQGPVMHDQAFTLDTLKLYSRIYPSVDLILSTWEGEDLAAIEQAALPRLHILRNAKPTAAGPSNINYQITSARQGLAYALDKVNPDYVLKTRTDMRLYNPNFLLDMLALMDGFPARQTQWQEQRLVIISDVVKYMMYAVPDKNMFGTAHDMWGYWDQALDERTTTNLTEHASMRTYSREAPAEVYLLRGYLARLGWPLAESLADHFDVLRDLFVVYDRAAADLYWHKYAHHLEYRFKQYAHNQILEEFSFNDWLRLQSGRLRPCDSDAIVNAENLKSINHLIQAHTATGPG